MYPLTILFSLLLHLACYGNAQSLVSDRFCPWCYWTVPDSMAGLPEFRFDSFCHAFVHQPISDRPGLPSPQKPIHVAIMNNNFTELLSYSRMGYGMSVDLPTRPTRCAPGVATFHMSGREDQQGGDGSLRPPTFSYSVRSDENYTPPQLFADNCINLLEIRGKQKIQTINAPARGALVDLQTASIMLASLLPVFFIFISTGYYPAQASPAPNILPGPGGASSKSITPGTGNSQANNDSQILNIRADANWIDWSSIGERFCPWCEAGVDSNDGASPEDKVCRVVVHQPMAAGSPPNTQFAHIAILNARYTELLSYKRMGWNQQENLWTSVGAGSEGAIATVFTGQEGVRLPPKILWQRDGKLSVTILPLYPGTEGSAWKVVQNVAPNHNYLIFHTWFFCGK
ncbi:hypothetical protein NEUTE1DRAFT_47328 [Neurospora tetrasperma FGSC 2508]|uniref:Uncharacterized protein n=1 Tax=Neurospora tetrasperma (strain FGSC 2508 / ATCC MYA-4615 / P0657) TaxID=510951 RepID=F8MTL1_NEUT8|nr:uncharacterized protein NEUTE1DRAFT_47328 [Neurospora tetrasperma FGSC 2508]EGO55343.1 hypothetical protein NEUTE1DRAFT_47328 [Neurospora tetrasperma FGSC 2508]EGZ69432.1 hypothetical protein NEUTE2DRAFT_71122 [Neurospora tetrasperma FGSC 2509]